MCTVLEARVKGSPPPKIIWKREGEVIKDSIDFRMLQKGEVCTLVVGDVYPEDAGMFTCEAYNEYGSDLSSARLIVKGQNNIHSISTHVSANRAYHPSGPKVINTYQPTTSSYLSSLPSVKSQTSSMTSALHQQYDAMAKYGGDDFKKEKGALIADMAKRIASPGLNPEKRRYHPQHKTLRLIERDIERMQMESPSNHQEAVETVSPTQLAFSTPTCDKVYKVSSFEQKLMSEIEYRLEQTPPVIELPEDNMYEDVEPGKEMIPIFTDPLKNYKALRGTAATFSCTVDGLPKPKVFWFKDGKQISKRSQHYVQASEGNTHTLSIEILSNEDDGNYTALAYAPQGKKTSTGRLVVATSLKPDASTHIPNGISRRTHRSTPSPSMTSPVTSPTSPPPHSAPLPSMGSAFDDNGVKSPHYPNGQRKYSYPAVNASPRPFIPARGELAPDEESPVDKVYRPSFYQRPRPQEEGDESKTLRFDVKVTGLPAPTIEWRFNGHPVRSGPRHTLVVRENNVHSLLFSRLSLADQGTYEVVATNKAGSNTAEIYLTVKPKEQIIHPQFVQRLQPTQVVVGDSVRLEVRVTAQPMAKITWKKGNLQINHNSQTQLYTDESGYSCLQIAKSELKDSAWYTVSAGNKAGIASCNCKLDVFAPVVKEKPRGNKVKIAHRYAQLAKTSGVDMTASLITDSKLAELEQLPESEDL